MRLIIISVKRIVPYVWVRIVTILRNVGILFIEYVFWNGLKKIGFVLCVEFQFEFVHNDLFIFF